MVTTRNQRHWITRNSSHFKPVFSTERPDDDEEDDANDITPPAQQAPPQPPEPEAVRHYPLRPNRGPLSLKEHNNLCTTLQGM